MPALMDGVRRLNLSVLFVVGGDGSHRLAASIAAAAAAQSIHLSVACVPKTIDNDLPVIDRSFGFETAGPLNHNMLRLSVLIHVCPVSEAVRAVRCAKIEASCTPDGVGIVSIVSLTFSNMIFGCPRDLNHPPRSDGM
jgi:6-phosphofructokinase 1